MWDKILVGTWLNRMTCCLQRTENRLLMQRASFLYRFPSPTKGLEVCHLSAICTVGWKGSDSSWQHSFFKASKFFCFFFKNITFKVYIGVPRRPSLCVMVCYTVTLGVLLVSGIIKLSTANKDTCDVYGAVGQSLSLPFVYGGLTYTHVVRWTHNTTIVFYREKAIVTVGTQEDISMTGSLLLKNLKFSSAGIYQVHVLSPNGTLTKSWTGRLCMMESVSKPQLVYVCDFKLKAVNLNCVVAKPHGLTFSWSLDEKTLTSETKPALSVSLTQLKEVRRFTCSVANKVSTEKSDTVRPTCRSPPPPALLCFTSRTVVAALAGGAGVILLLLLIIVVLCCCHRRNKTKMRLGNKGGIRMISLKKQELESLSPEYETMQPTGDSASASPKPSPRAFYHNVSQAEVQIENRPPKVSIAADGPRPSPVPKPRTKSPQTQNS